MVNHPHYAFAHSASCCMRWFAWRPVRLWYGDYVWLCYVSRQLYVKNDYLDGPDAMFWSYTK
jgi:hypothetical protein